LSLRNRVISMDELIVLFKDPPNHKRDNSTAKPVSSLAAMNRSALHIPLATDTGTADTFEKLFMKKLFVYQETFQCTTSDLDRISPTGHSLYHNKIIFTDV
jgi:hypothetical protein